MEGKSPSTINAGRETVAIFWDIAREEGLPEGVRAVTAFDIALPTSDHLLTLIGA